MAMGKVRLEPNAGATLKQLTCQKRKNEQRLYLSNGEHHVLVAQFGVTLQGCDLLSLVALRMWGGEGGGISQTSLAQRTNGDRECTILPYFCGRLGL